MSELLKLFKIESRKLFRKRKVLAALLLAPAIMGIIIVLLANTTISTTNEPVRVCANPAYNQIIEAAGGTPVQQNCEVSIAAPTEFYYRINIYENTARAQKLEEFVKSFIEQYYYSSIGKTPTTTEKTVLVIGDRVKIINAAPGKVMQTLFDLMTGLPLILFMSLLIGNEYVSTSFTTQREKRLLDLISSYPIHRRNIILSKILLGIVFGIISVAFFAAGTAAMTLLLTPHLGTAQQPEIQLGIQIPPGTVILTLADTLLAIIFTYFVSAAIAFKTRDPSDTSITSMLVSSLLNFSLIIPAVTGSFSVFRYSIVPLIIPTLIPIKVSLLGLEGKTLTATLYTLYLAAAVVLSYKALMRGYEKSFE